ncbi:MAG: hypothetical protein U0U67_05910 [Chitinophagales bacterium]
MKKLRAITIAICAISVFMATCKKSGETEDRLTVTINSPTEGTTYTGSMNIAFSIAATKGIDSCSVILKDASPLSSLSYFANYFLIGSDIVHGKTSFNYSYNFSGGFPSTLTAAQFIINVVDLEKHRFSKTINVNIQD